MEPNTPLDLAGALTKAALRGGDLPNDEIETATREILPPVPAGPSVSLPEIHAWLQALPESMALLVAPLATLAAEAVRRLAHETGQSEEQIVADITAALA